MTRPLPPATDRVQGRTVLTLMGSQTLGGIGVASGLAVGAIVAADVSGNDALSGLATTTQVLGGALFTIPVVALMARFGRRLGLVAAYLVGGLGAFLAITATATGLFWLLLVGTTLFGASTTAGNQARYAATDLSPPERRGRHLSWVVWATTVGSVLGPNLIGPGERIAALLGIPPLAGAWVLSMAGFGLAALVLVVLLRPDPLLLARTLADDAAAGPDAAGHDPVSSLDPAAGVDPAAVPDPLGTPDPLGAPDPLATPDPAIVSDPAERPPATPVTARRGNIVEGLRLIRATPAALWGTTALTVGHVVMVSVMVMTPLHMRHGEAEIEVIGLVISLHILGMYGLSPVVGQLVDRWGAVRVVLLGVAILLLSCALAAVSADGHSGTLTAALVLLGLGWSCTMVAGSGTIAGAVPLAERAAVQGAADLVMGLSAAAGGALAGVVMDQLGFDVLAVVSGLAALALGVLTVARRRVVSLGG